MTKKSNVHPDHYKTDGRDRPDDAAAARLNRAIVAKMASRERPHRPANEFYFERPEPERPAAPEGRADRGTSKAPSRPGTARKAASRKGTAPRRTAKSRKTGAKARKKSGVVSSGPAKTR
jgi:hypothetical protein